MNKYILECSNLNLVIRLCEFLNNYDKFPFKENINEISFDNYLIRWDGETWTHDIQDPYEDHEHIIIGTDNDFFEFKEKFLKDVRIHDSFLYKYDLMDYLLSDYE